MHFRAQYFTARSNAFQAQVEEWQQAGAVDKWAFRPFIYDNSHCHWEESSNDIDRWCGTPVMKTPITHLLDTAGLTVELNTTVSEISKTPDGLWAVRSNERDWDPDHFDAVLFAVPSPQAAPLVATHSPQLLTVANSAEMRGAWALMLQYKVPLDLPFNCAFINGGPLSWISRDSSKPSRDSSADTWLVHSTTAWSHDHIDHTPEDVAEELIAALCSLHPPPGSAEIPPPDEWSAHRWRFATTHPNLNVRSSWDTEARLGLCGDWLDEGKVEGAWASGQHLAECVGADVQFRQ